MKPFVFLYVFVFFLTQQPAESLTNVGYNSCSKSVCIRMSRQDMIDEIVEMWNLWADDEKVYRRGHPQRKKFPKYAKYIVDAVRLYQVKETGIGGKLPMGRNTHLVVAAMAIHETSVRHWIIGWKKGEVGLLQIHGEGPLLRHSSEKVRRTPRLGIKLGVRWLAYHTQFCTPNPTDDLDQWAEVLSLYGAGIKRGKKSDGTCRRMMSAKKRVNTTKKYIERIR
jgi:hypothetical protein